MTIELIGAVQQSPARGAHVSTERAESSRFRGGKVMLAEDAQNGLAASSARVSNFLKEFAIAAVHV